MEKLIKRDLFTNRGIVSFCQESVEVAGTFEIKAWIMNWGSHALVLEPESLREEIRAEAMAILNRHHAELEEKPLEA